MHSRLRLFLFLAAAVSNCSGGKFNCNEKKNGHRSQCAVFSGGSYRSDGFCEFIVYPIRVEDEKRVEHQCRWHQNASDCEFVPNNVLIEVSKPCLGVEEDTILRYTHRLGRILGGTLRNTFDKHAVRKKRFVADPLGNIQVVYVRSDMLLR